MSKLRLWLIRLLVGDTSLVMNCTIYMPEGKSVAPPHVDGDMYFIGNYVTWLSWDRNYIIGPRRNK